MNKIIFSFSQKMERYLLDRGVKVTARSLETDLGMLMERISR
ncbi:hypothetical protein [Ectobacillus funiculus]|nr:hypothetical protein [Ectobacillus funiculus]